MKATELQYGNYVSVKQSGLIIQIAAIHQKKVGFHFVQNKLDWVRISMLEPICITSEILEKHGFVRDKEYSEQQVKQWGKEAVEKMKFVLNAKYRTIIVYWCPQLCIASISIVKYRGYGIPPTMQQTYDLPFLVGYFHELQNILRLCDVEL